MWGATLNVMLRLLRMGTPPAYLDAESLAGSLRLVGLAALFADPLQLRLLEKKRELVRMDEVNKLIDGICDVVLTHLSSLPARCAPRGDLAIRRSIERVVFEARTETANCQQMADKCSEPPLDEQS